MIDMADALLILSKIRTFHGQQDQGNGACESWAQALNAGCVRSVPDAVEAVVRHYSLPGCNPWITPGDVIEGVRVIRRERLDAAGFDTVTPNVDPDDIAAYRDEIAAIRAAIGDGRFDPAAYAASGVTLSGARPLKAIGDGRKPPALEGRISLHPDRLAAAVRRPERPLPVDYGTAPVKYVPPVSEAEIERRDAEKARQMAAMSLLMAAEAAEVAS